MKNQPTPKTTQKKNQRSSQSADFSLTISGNKLIDTHSHLNAKQKEVVQHLDGPLLVIAGAGTGKTRVLTERIAHLLKSEKVTSEQVLALTFTDKAAAEMSERLDTLMPLGYQEVELSTFHAFCDKILRRYGADIGLPIGYKILSGVEQWQFVRERLFDFDLSYYRPLGNPNKFISALVSHFSKLKEELVSPDAYLKYAEQLASEAEAETDELDAKKYLELAGAYAQYQQLLIENNYLDFADLQYFVLELFDRRPNVLKYLQSQYLYIMVDEYQDTNIAQNAIVDRLAAKHCNLMVVGDDDQSIYKFRGAAISNILKFEKQYPGTKKIVLTQNYRSNQRILDFAYTSVQHNNPDRLEIQSDVDKRLIGQTSGSDDSISVVHCSTIEQEVEYVIEKIKSSEVPLSEIAVLCRANAYAQPYIEAFKKYNIPYQFPSERGLYNKKEIVDLIALLRFLANPTDDISLYRILRMPLWSIQMERILDWMQASKKAYHKLWTHVKSEDQNSLLVSTLSDLISFSKEHSVGETLYRFTESIQLYERLLKNGSIEAEEQIVNIASFFQKIRDFERNQREVSVVDFVSYLNLVEEAGDNPAAPVEIEGRDGIQISTIHSAKGLEFHTVFVASMAQLRFPTSNRKDPIPMPDALVKEVLSDSDQHLAEERRLFYVAATRAKENLHLLYSDFYAPSSALKPRKKKPSIFISELEGKIAWKQIEKTVEGVETFLKPQISTPEQAITKNAVARITQFSYSQLSTFENCPRQYQYQYVYKIPTPPSGALSFGITMHSTLQEFYTMVQQSKQASLFTEFSPDLSFQKLLEIYENKWIDRGYESRQHMEARKTRGREILSQFYEKFKTNIPQVKFLEKGFKLKIGDYTISGRIDRADDRADGTLEIIDYKTGKSRDEKSVQKDLQLAIYAMAAQDCFQIPASLLSLHFLDEDKEVSIEPNQDTIEVAKQKVAELGDRVNQGDFTPKPDKIKCGFCPYKKICDSAA